MVPSGFFRSVFHHWTKWMRGDMKNNYIGGDSHSHCFSHAHEKTEVACGLPMHWQSHLVIRTELIRHSPWHMALLGTWMLASKLALENHRTLVQSHPPHNLSCGEIDAVLDPYFPPGDRHESRVTANRLARCKLNGGDTGNRTLMTW